jgi:hypothetical protein
MRGNKLLFLSLSVAIVAFSVALYLFSPYGHRPQAWNSNAITASYIGAQLREIDPGNATLFLAYELQNHTDSDYRLSDGPGILFMSRLHPDGSLSSQEQIHLSYPTFLPARQRARVALEIAHPFGWPAENDPLFQDKLKQLFNQRLTDVQAFVLFDQVDRFQIEFPGGWREFKVAAAATK